VKVFLVAWLGVCLVAGAAEEKEIIRDKSPDGKFALRFTRDDKGFWEGAVINLKSKGAEMGLEIYQNGYIEQAHLVWSKDSQRVAYFEPDRRGGSTTVYFRNGDEFKEAELPELPECKKTAPKQGESHVKTVEETTAPQKWLSSGALVLKVHLEDLMENERGQHSQPCTQIVTIAFDSSHKGSVQSAKQVKVDR
jgi:hypothetical protein